MPQLPYPRRRLHPVRLACVTAAASLCSASLLAQTPLCTLTFADPAILAVLDAPARACLNQAAAQFHSHSGTRIILSGANAQRVSTSRQYLVGTDGLPASGVSATITPGDPHLVRLAFLPPQELQLHHPPIPAPPPTVQPLPAYPGHHHEITHGPQPTPVVPQPTGSPVLPTNAQPIPPPALPPPDSHQAAVPVHGANTGGLAPHPTAQQPDGAAQAHQPQTGTGIAQPAHAAPGHPAQPYPAGEEVQKWVNQLKTGGIEFNSPQTMVAGTSTGVVVIIHGYADTGHSDLPGIEQQGTVKVSDHMRVDLDAPFAPGEFAITPAQGAKLPVRVDGSAMWEFQVTPQDGSPTPQTLVVHPYLYPPNKLDAQPLQERNFAVTVTVESLGHHLVRLWHEDPVKVLKYLLPGGKGWSGLGAFLTGLIALLTSLGVIAWIRHKLDPQDPAEKK